MADATDTTTTTATTPPKEKKEKKPTSYDILVPLEINLTDQAGLKTIAEKYGANFTALVNVGTADGLNPKQALSEHASKAPDGTDPSGAYKVVATASINDFPHVRFETAKPKLVIG